MDDLLPIMKVLGQATRLRILNLLNEQQLCVCEIRNILDLNQSTASRHLNKLKQSGLIYSEKDAQWVHYYLDRELIEAHSFIAQLLREELEKYERFQADVDRLNTYLESSYTCENLDEADIF